MNDQKSATNAPALLAVSLALLAPIPALAQPPRLQRAHPGSGQFIDQGAPIDRRPAVLGG